MHGTTRCSVALRCSAVLDSAWSCLVQLMPEVYELQLQSDGDRCDYCDLFHPNLSECPNKPR